MYRSVDIESREVFQVGLFGQECKKKGHPSILDGL
jgi:hypothetical protein